MRVCEGVVLTIFGLKLSIDRDERRELTNLCVFAALSPLLPLTTIPGQERKQQITNCT